MIAYEDLCGALNRYNHRLRGEEVPAETYSDDFDVVESEAAAAVSASEYLDVQPEVTAETALPPADLGAAPEYQQAPAEGYDQEYYDQQAVPGQPTDAMESNQYSSGQVAAPPPPPPPDAGYPSGTYDQPADPEGTPQPDGMVPDGEDPNRQ